VNASVSNTVKSNDSYFKQSLPNVYNKMAQVLEQRGVYQQALEYIKDSLSQKSDLPMTYDIEADVLEGLHRYTECIAAEQQAIRLSDGKYSWMQFRLGNCYFDTEDWVQAATSFRIVAEADKTDASSAYNLGLSLYNQGYKSDASVWYREALNRKPDEELRAKIQHALQP
jgi:tetratricopeptide (TPR) repeat protein